MRIGANNLEGRSARNRRVNDPAYVQYLADVAKEQAESKAALDAALDAAQEADPMKAFQKASDAEALALQELLRTGFVPESVLPGVERINGRKVVESVQISNWKYFADTCLTFQRWQAEQLIDASLRNDIAPVAANYLALHNLMLQYGAYVEPAQPAVEQPVAVAEEVVFVDRAGYEWTQSAINALSASDRAGVNHQIYCEKTLGHSEDGKAWTMQMIDRLPSNEMRSLLLLFERGHRSRADQYFDVKDAQKARDAEIARRTAAEAHEEGR